LELADHVDIGIASPVKKIPSGVNPTSLSKPAQNGKVIANEITKQN
jgi:hypothetical protein